MREAETGRAAEIVVAIAVAAGVQEAVVAAAVAADVPVGAGDGMAVTAAVAGDGTRLFAAGLTITNQGRQEWRPFFICVETVV